MHPIPVRLLCTVAVLLPVSLVAQERAASTDSTSIPSSESVLASTERLAWVPATGSSVAPLQRRIAVDLRGAAVRDALDAVARAGGLLIGYSADAARARGSVSLHVDGMPVRDALARVLEGTPFAAYVSLNGRQILVRRPFPEPEVTTYRQAGGTLTGRALDAATHIPLDQVAVRVEGLTLGAATGGDGRYVVRNIPPGTYRVAARRVGYTPLTMTVIVATDSVATADFALMAAPTRLNEMVTTAVGDQRRYELGNSIATINADSITKTAPITNLTDVLSGRAPGVEVLESQGVAGGPVRIRIRGLSSLQLTNDPIVYIDGIRINADPGGANPSVPIQYGGYDVGSRLNDLNPDEIASIEILKGPSAATEYGTDAANGVIVIKTKQGRAGAPQWAINTEQGFSNVPTRFAAPRYGWGHTTDGTNTPVECPLTNGYGAPSVGAGTCALDSMTTFQALDHASTSVLTTGHSQQYNAQVSGGTQQLRYFLAGSVASQTGVLHMDPVDVQAMADSGKSIPSYARTPNVTNGTTLRGRFAVPLGNTADVAVSTGYISNYARGAPLIDIIQGAEGGLGYRDPLYHGWLPAYNYLPRDAFLNTASQAVARFTGGMTASWRPATWLVTHGTVAVDAGSENDLAFRSARSPEPPNAFGEFVTYNAISQIGYRGDERQSTDLYTVDLGGTATVRLTPVVTTKTSAGMQYNDTRQVGTSLKAYGLSPNSSFNGAQISIPGEIGNYAKTFGSYIEEMVGLEERLFLTAAVRVDAGSGFGQQVRSAVYPKASASWLVWETPQASVRLRAAYGASGVQPTAGSTLTLFAPGGAIVGGTPASGDTLAAVGNPKLKPERQSEFEGGVDASVLNRRVDLELTYYTKLSRDALVNVTLPMSIGARTEEENVGSVRNYGLEGSVTVRVLDARPVQWDVTAGGSVNTNRLVSLASGVTPIDGLATTGLAQFRDLAGYPVDGLWAPLLHYGDLNHDGIIEPNEVTIGGAMAYVGPSLPTQELTLSTSIGLWNGRLRVSTQVDHRGGFTIENYNALNNVDGTLSAPVLNNPHASLFAQARAVEGQQVFSPLNSGYMENGAFTRWRELSVRYALPDWLARAARGRTASVTLSGRNLVLWTRYTGLDPEATTTGFEGGAIPIDAAFDFNSFPLVRTWRARVDVGF